MLKRIKLFLYSIALGFGKIIYYNRSSKVLYYHDVHNDTAFPETPMSTPLSLFKKHLDLIKKNGFEVVGEITQPKNQIMLTFDDGFKGVYLNKECFISNNLKPMVFLITEKMGNTHFLNSDEIKELTEVGFNFQSHTHSHPDLNELSEKDLRFEFEMSNEILKKTVAINSNAICFPKGFFNNLTINTATLSGYENLYSSIPGAYFDENRFQIKHRNLVQFSSPFDFNCILFGGLNIFKKRYTKQHYYE